MKLRWLPLTVLFAAAMCLDARGQEAAAADAVQARLRALFTVPADWFVPKEANPQSDKLRLLLIVPGGPVLVEAQLTATSGRPYSAFFEEQIDLLVKRADRDADGKLAWATEGMGMRLPSQRLALLARDKEIWLPALDVDGDGVASRYELRRLLSLAGGGPPLTVGSPQGSPLTTESCFQQLVDRNSDGVISAQELDQLEKRLRMRDADDNELVDSYELLGAKADAFQTSRRFSLASVVLLSEETDWTSLQKELQTKFGAKDRTLGAGEPRLSLMTAELDSNTDRQLDATELRKLLTVEPQVHVMVNLGETDPQSRVASFKSLSDSMRATAKISRLPEDKKQMLLEAADLRLALHSASAPERTRLNDSMARTYLKRYDKDQNGYLDEKEATGELSLADTNGDKKIYPDEIVAYFAESALLTSNRIYVTLTEEPKALFKVVDDNNDGQLSQRELGDVKHRLLGLDANKNGQLDPEEFPGLLRLTFSQGINPNLSRSVGRVFVPNPLRRSGFTSDWFTEMDTNGDEDISKREFLGTPEQFATFDTNQDGLVSREEAWKAK